MNNKSGADFWMDVDKFDPSDTKHLSQVQKGITNFVNILTDLDIPVSYAISGDSYTDGEHIVISSNVSPKSLDYTVGLTLHEASHILLSDFGILREDKFSKICSDAGHPTPADREFIFLLTNFVEDKRIDHFVYTSAPGYRHYYSALYKKFFFNKEIDKLVSSDEFTQGKVRDYQFRIINILNQNTDFSKLPKLKEVYDIIDVKNITRLKNTKDCIDVALQIYNTIKSHIDFSPETEKPSDKKTGNRLSKQKDFLKGEIKKATMSRKKAIKINEQANIPDERVGNPRVNLNPPKALGKSNNITKYDSLKIIDTWHSPSYTLPLDAVSKGISMGKKLMERLTPLADVKSIDNFNLKKGKLDNKKLFKSTFDENIFHKKEIESVKDTLIHLSIDASFSMKGKKWDNTIKTAVSIAYASCHLEGFDVVITFRGDTVMGIEDSLPALSYVFDSRRDNVSKLNKFKQYRPWGNTPEGLCIDFINKTIELPSPNKDVYFINISDGMPNRPFNNITDNLNYTAKMVKALENKGIKILSYFIPSSPHSLGIEGVDFKKMYGRNACFIDIDNISQIARTVNGLLVKNKMGAS